MQPLTRTGAALDAVREGTIRVIQIDQDVVAGDGEFDKQCRLVTALETSLLPRIPSKTFKEIFMKIMRMALTFGIGLAALASNAAFANQFNIITMEFGADRPAYDYKQVVLNGNEPLACQLLCVNDSACKAYTFEPIGVTSLVPRCYLKYSNASVLTPKPGLISGRKLP